MPPPLLRMGSGGIRMPLPLPPTPHNAEDFDRVSEWLGLLEPVGTSPLPGSQDPALTEEDEAAERKSERRARISARTFRWFPAEEDELRNLLSMQSSRGMQQVGANAKTPSRGFMSPWSFPGHASPPRPGPSLPSTSSPPKNLPPNRRRQFMKSPSEASLSTGSRRRSYGGATEKLSSGTMLANTSLITAAKSLRRGASEELLSAVVMKLSPDNKSDCLHALADIEFLCTTRYPKGFMKFGKWVWTARGAEDNRKSLGDDQKLWDIMRQCLKCGDADVAVPACGALEKLVVKSSCNVVAMIASPGMLVAMVDLLDSDKQSFKVQIHAWRVFLKCVSVEDVKDVICNSTRFLEHLRKACMCSMEEVRVKAVNVVMNASTNSNAQCNLNKACIAEQALSTVMLSSEDLMETRLRASVACAFLVGTQETSVLSQAHEMIRQPPAFPPPCGVAGRLLRGASRVLGVECQRAC
mmetsp:Transcript_31251/g.72817  ORF Transcript_31251/g.72817 Transcript_31251/m.72817 type:complete len:468 (+) Transcript_31251:131-1534(+)